MLVYNRKRAHIIGLVEKLQETYFDGKKKMFPVTFPFNQSIDHTPSDIIRLLEFKIKPHVNWGFPEVNSSSKTIFGTIQ